MTFKWITALCLALSLSFSTGVTAQDDFDFEALLEDISDEPAVSAPAEAVESAPAPVADAPQVAAVDDPAAEEDPFADLFEGADEPPAVEVEEPAPTPVAPAAAEPEAEADPFGDLFESGSAEPPPPPAVPAAAAPAVEEDDPFAALLGDDAAADLAEVEEESSNDVSFEELLGGDQEEDVAPAEVVESASSPAGDGEPSREEKLAELLGIPVAEAATILEKQEEVRRQASEEDARRSLDEGFTALAAEDFGTAIKKFEDALEMPARKQNQDDLDRARWGYSDAAFRLADNLYDNYRATHRRDKLEGSANWLEKGLAYTPDHAESMKLYERVQKELAKPVHPIPLVKQDAFEEKVSRIDKLIREGKEYFYVGDYDKAESLFESILLEDEYNVDAMRLLTKIYEGKYQAATKEREKTTAEMITEVRDAWNPPIHKLVIPEGIEGGRLSSDANKLSGVQALERKLESIIIPTLDYREANIADVVADLVDHSIAGDKDGVGVNIVLNLKRGGTAAAKAAPAATGGGFDAGFGGGFEDPFATPEAGFGGDSGFGGSVASVPTITLNLRRVTLYNAIRYITEVAGLKFRAEEDAVIITPTDVAQGQVFTRMYPVQPSFIDVIFERDESAGAGGGGGFGEFGGGEFGAPVAMSRGDVRDFFEKIGVRFPEGTSITYNSSLSKLIVTHTEEMHDKIERILEELNQVPYQVEIEAKFVEVQQSDMEELGLEWLLTDDFEIARNQQNAFAGIAGQERVQLDRNDTAGGISKGLRFFNFNNQAGAASPVAGALANSLSTPLGSVLSFSSVLTNPEMSVVLHALDQSGNTDLLSAPRVTTRTGQPALIQVVEEIIYPTEFEQEITTIDVDEGADQQIVTVTPGAFETRPIGVILSVTPTVGPDGYTINLDLAPEVAELVSWLNYGSEFQGQEIFIPQPVFSSRNVTTSISIWDGQTVVMGGLIREDLIKIDDKIPFLGDIPFIGRLFRVEGEKSVKKNLIIFVTARLVKPDGKPLNTVDLTKDSNQEAVAQ